MKETVQKIVNNMEEANEMSKVLLAYNKYLADKETDEKKKAQYKMRADSFEVTIEEKEMEITQMKEFLAIL